MTKTQLENINKTLIKQRDDAELKVKRLLSIIDDELLPLLSHVNTHTISTELNEIEFGEIE